MNGCEKVLVEGCEAIELSEMKNPSLETPINIAGVHMAVHPIDELYPATSPAALEDRIGRSAWPGRCPWNGPTSVNGFDNFQLVLVSSHR